MLWSESCRLYSLFAYAVLFLLQVEINRGLYKCLQTWLCMYTTVTYGKVIVQLWRPVIRRYDGNIASWMKPLRDLVGDVCDASGSPFANSSWWSPDVDAPATERPGSMHEFWKPGSSPPPALSCCQFVAVALLVRITAVLLPAGYWDRRSQVLFRFASRSSSKSRILRCIVPDLVFTYIHILRAFLDGPIWLMLLTPFTIKRLFTNKSLFTLLFI